MGIESVRQLEVAERSERMGRQYGSWRSKECSNSMDVLWLRERPRLDVASGSS